MTFAVVSGTGLDWVTPHTFRKTVATPISERVGADTAAQQLGHSSPAITREFYISKPAIAADGADVLEELGRSKADDRGILGEEVGNSTFGFKCTTGSDHAFALVRAGFRSG